MRVAIPEGKIHRKGTRQPMSHQQNTPDPLLLPLLLDAQGGSQSAFEALLGQYAPLIDSMTARFSLPALSLQDREDLHQEAVVAFYRALMRYDTARAQIPFGYFAKECIRNRLISHLRTLKHLEHTVSLEEEPILTEGECSANPAQRLVEQENYSALCQQVCGILSEYENRVWWLYLAGRTAKEVASLLGTDERSVQNAIYRIRKKLRSGLPYS